MATTKYVPVKGDSVKTYIFQVEVEHEEDGRWSAWVPTLPGCATWGYTREEALEALHDAAQAYIDVLIESGGTIPKDKGVETRDVPAVAVTV